MQENSDDDEILNAVKYVRPGNGFEPNFDVYGKIEVNGANVHPVYQLMKGAAPDWPRADQRCTVVDTGPSKLKLVPNGLGDVQWNFEKFLVDRNGFVAGRYAFNQMPETLADDIAALIKGE